MTFDDIEIDVQSFELRRGGERIAVEPKVFDLIHFMVQNANRVISKDELIEALWQGRVISDAALSTAIKSARRALGESDPSTGRLKTLRGRGFRFDLPEEDTAKEPSATPMSIYVQPSLSLLPISGDIKEADGTAIRRRVTAAMARVPFISVLAPAQVSQSTPDGPGFAFECDVRATSTGHEIACLLFDRTSGETLWSYTTDPFEDVGAVDVVANTIAVRLEPQLVRATYAALLAHSAPKDARAKAMAGLGVMSLKGWNRPAFDEAEAALKEAIALDPTLAFAHAALGLITALGQEIGLSTPDPSQRDVAIAHAEKAISLDGMSPLILGLAGCALCDAGQAMRGKALLDRALDLDRDNPQAMAALGAQMLRERNFKRSVDLLRRAIWQSPQDTTLAVWRSILAQALMREGDLDGAREEAQRAVAADDRTHLSRMVLCAIEFRRGQTEAAKEAWDDAHRVTPDLSKADIAAMMGTHMADTLKDAFDG